MEVRLRIVSDMARLAEMGYRYRWEIAFGEETVVRSTDYWYRRKDALAHGRSHLDTFLASLEGVVQ